MSDVDENETKTEDVDVDVDEVIDTVVDNGNDNENDDGNDTDTETTTNQLGTQWSGDTTTFVEEKRKSVREGAAFDVIMVQDSEGTLYENSDYLVSFKGEKETTGGTITNEDPNKMVVLELLVPTDDLVPGDTVSDKVWFQINKGVTGTGSDGENENEKDPKQENLKALKMYLHSGRNPMRYLLLNLEQHTIVGMASANIFVYSQHDSIVVSDIDGTVTKSNAAGLLGTVGPFKEALYGKVTHEGICHLLSTLASQKNENENENGTTQVVYLTSRPTLLANQTRQFLIELTQPATTSTATTTNENTVDDDNESARTTANKEANDIGLPRGPLLGFGGKVSNVLVMELISHTANEFKSKKLWQQVVQPFREANNNNNNTDSNENDTNHPTFVAGFGNNTRDMQAYHSIGMDLHRIYMIDKKSRIVIFDKKMEKDDDKNETDPATKEDTTTTTNNHPTDFQSEQFYKDRIGTTFDEGYTDTKLFYQLGFYDHNEEKKANISKYFGGKMNKWIL